MSHRTRDASERENLLLPTACVLHRRAIAKLNEAFNMESRYGDGSSLRGCAGDIHYASGRDAAGREDAGHAIQSAASRSYGGPPRIHQCYDACSRIGGTRHKAQDDMCGRILGLS